MKKTRAALSSLKTSSKKGKSELSFPESQHTGCCLTQGMVCVKVTVAHAQTCVTRLMSSVKSQPPCTIPSYLLWLARFDYKNSPDILRGVGSPVLQRCYSVLSTATHFWVVWADNSPQSDSCLGLLRSDAGCRRFSAFPDAFFLNIFFFSRGGLFSASLWVSRSWPGTSFSQKKCLVCSRKALIHNKGFEWKNSHLALLKYKLREVFFSSFFLNLLLYFLVFFR